MSFLCHLMGDPYQLPRMQNHKLEICILRYANGLMICMVMWNELGRGLLTAASRIKTLGFFQVIAIRSMLWAMMATNHLPGRANSFNRSLQPLPWQQRRGPTDTNIYLRSTARFTARDSRLGVACPMFCSPTNWTCGTSYIKLLTYGTSYIKLLHSDWKMSSRRSWWVHLSDVRTCATWSLQPSIVSIGANKRWLEAFVTSKMKTDSNDSKTNNNLCRIQLCQFTPE